MKIPTNTRPPVYPEPPRTEQTPGGKETTTDKVNQATGAPPSSVHNASRIEALFARIGIATHMPLSEGKERRRIIDRRRDMLAIQRIQNLQAVMEVALSVTLPDTSQENIDPDWFFAFTQLAENIYSPAMQELWGKIFAVEVSRPGSFSMRSLETLKALTQRDARLFTKAATIASRRKGDTVPRIIIGYHQRPGLLTLLGHRQPDMLNLSAFGLSYPDLLALTDMKLIFSSEIESGELATDQAVDWRCGNESFSLTPKKTGLALVYYKFTAVGAELCKLVSRQDARVYIDTLKQRLDGGFNIG